MEETDILVTFIEGNIFAKSLTDQGLRCLQKHFPDYETGNDVSVNELNPDEFLGSVEPGTVVMMVDPGTNLLLPMTKRDLH